MKVATFGKILGNFSPIVPPSAGGVSSRRFRRGGAPGGGNWNVLITGTPGWGFDVPLATLENHLKERAWRLDGREFDDYLLRF